MPVVLLLLFNILFYASTELFRLHREHAIFRTHGVFVIIAASFLAAVAVPRLFDLRTIPEKRLVGLAALAALFFAGPAAVLFLLDVPHIRHWIFPAATLMIGPAAFYLYFGNGQPKHRSLIFGAALGLGLGVNLFVLHAFEAAGVEETTVRRLYEIVSLALLALFAAGICRAYLSPDDVPTLPPPEKDELPVRVRHAIIARILGATVLFYGISGFFASARITPAVSMERHDLLRLAVLCVCPCVGAILDRWPEKSYRALSLCCGLLFMLAPSLPLLQNSPTAYGLVLGLVSVCQFSFFMGSTLALSALASGRWRCLTLCAPYIARFATLPGAWAAGFIRSLDDGVQVGVAILGCLGFYHLVQNAYAIYNEAAAAGLREGAATRGTSEAFAKRFDERGLTAREREVAAGILRGLSSPEIARELAISENTVNTHVRTILKKFAAPSRMAFMAELTADVFAGGGERKN